MDSLLGITCNRCGREFDVPSDLSKVQCPGCRRWISTVGRGLDIPEPVIDYTDPRDLSHEWDCDYFGENHTVRGSQYLQVRYEEAIGEYVITFRGGNPDEGRHWDRSSPPEARRSDYADALREYLKFAERYAPADVISKVRKDVARKLKG